jgi:ABC-type microcin C transport system permease subunit YejE
MKKITSVLAVLLLLSLPVALHAQDSPSVVKKTGKAIKKGAKKVGNKTAEVASKSKAAVTDEKHKDKVGPNGQTIYIDNHSKYYWVDDKGHRHYVTEAELKPKIKD